jgi:putative sigma-54 modulation protein
MNITITGRNLEVTSAIREYVEKEIGRFDRYLPNIDSVSVVLEVEKYRQKADVTVIANNMTLRGTEETNDLYVSIDSAIEKIEKQVHKKKEKWETRRHSGFSGGEVIAESVDEDVPGPRVYKQTIQFKPMPLDEAVMEFESSNHEFVVFTNAKTQRVNVLYRRRDGNLGLIEPA